LTENAFHVFTATLWKVAHDRDPQFKWMGASYRPQEYKLEFVAGLVFQGSLKEGGKEDAGHMRFMSLDLLR
jgi:hypothetical protein